MGVIALNERVVMIGASTGGVEAIEVILSSFPRNRPPTLIAQHMPEKFLRAFAMRLNRKVLPEVRLAKEGQLLEKGNVYLAPGGASHLEISAHETLCCHLNYSEKINGYRPSIDVFFESAAMIAGSVVAVLLTGMGADGANGLRSLRCSGAITIAQDEATSVVYGMPRAALSLGAVVHQAGLQQIAALILSSCSSQQGKPPHEITE